MSDVKVNLKSIRDNDDLELLAMKIKKEISDIDSLTQEALEIDADLAEKLIPLALMQSCQIKT